MTVLTVDGTNILYRSHFALAGTGLSHAGRPVWAVHGLLTTVSRFVAAHPVSHLVVAFDTRGGCPDRRALQPQYKQTRTPPEDDLAYQLEWAPMLLRQCGVGVWQVPGWEADDGLASVTFQASRRSLPVLVVSSDRDVLQLVTDTVTVATPDGSLVTPADVEAKWGVTAAQYPSLAALRGEPSDNLPGVTGVGPKMAAKLVATFGSIDAVLSASDAQLRAVVGPKAIEALRRDGELARLSYEVGRLRTDLPVDLDGAAVAAVDADRVGHACRVGGLPKAGQALASALAAAAAR